MDGDGKKVGKKVMMGRVVHYCGSCTALRVAHERGPTPGLEPQPKFQGLGGWRVDRKGDTTLRLVGWDLGDPGPSQVPYHGPYQEPIK